MKKLILLIAIALLASPSFAQLKNQFLLNDGSNFEYYRIDSKTVKNKIILNYYLSIERKLDTCLGYVKKNSAMPSEFKGSGDNSSSNINNQITLAKAVYQDLPIAEKYRQELDFYDKYNNTKILQIKVKKDSLDKIYSANYKLILEKELKFKRDSIAKINASINNFNKFQGLDSAEFVRVYGTLDEYELLSRMATISRRGGGGRIALCGYKIYWFNEPSQFLQNMGYALGDTKTVGKTQIWAFTERLASNRNAYSLKATISLNADDRINNIVINGDLVPVLSFFSGYWAERYASAPHLGKDDLKREYWNDRISIKRVGNKAILTITKAK